MPTVMDPKVTEEVKPEPVAPASKDPELFAAEVEMEGKSSGFMPLVLIAVCCLSSAGSSTTL